MTESARLQQSHVLRPAAQRFRVRRVDGHHKPDACVCRLRDRRDIFHCANLVTHDNVRCKCAQRMLHTDVFGVSRKHVAVLRQPRAEAGLLHRGDFETLVHYGCFSARRGKLRQHGAKQRRFAAARRTRDQQPHAGCAQQRTQNGVAGTQARASHAQIDGCDIFERKGSAAIHECRTAHARPVPARQRNKAVRDAIRKTVHRISADGLKAVLHQRVRRRQHACIRFFSPTAVYGNKPCAARRAKRHRAARTQADFRNVPCPPGRNAHQRLRDCTGQL